MSLAKRMVAGFIVLVVILTLAFIFYNATRDFTQSYEQSDAVAETVAKAVSPKTVIGGFIQDNLRSLAHFAEYGLLGTELSLLCILCSKRKLRYFIACSAFALSVAISDEILQGFFGRISDAVDVLIDVGGYLFFSVLVFLPLLVQRLVGKNIG